MSYEDKSLAGPPAEPAPEPHDSARSVSPDPSWPIEMRLKWYQVATMCLLLNCSETVRTRASREADRETARLMALDAPAASAPVYPCGHG